jgi:ribose 5-phosphate isomerase B
MRLGLASDHAGFELKELLGGFLRDLGHEVKDFGATILDPEDDYPDFVTPLAEAVVREKMDRGIALCGSGIGACIAANRIPGIRAGLCHDTYSARVGVRHNDLNVLVLGARVIGPELACEVIRTFLDHTFDPAPRHLRRLAKLEKLETRTHGQNSDSKEEPDEPIATTSQVRPGPLAG